VYRTGFFFGNLIRVTLCCGIDDIEYKSKNCNEMDKLLLKEGKTSIDSIYKTVHLENIIEII
jgi:hypothetical protein